MTREEALEVGRPGGTAPGWTVWHRPSGRAAIQPVRYKRDAAAARDELLTLGVDWTLDKPVSDIAGRRAYAPVYNKYRRLRGEQLANNPYWPRPPRQDA